MEGETVDELERLGECDEETVTERVLLPEGLNVWVEDAVVEGHRDEVTVTVSEPLAVKLTLCVDVTVEDRHCDGVLLPEEVRLGELERVEEDDDVVQTEGDALALFRAVPLPLEVNDALVVDETVEDRHSEDVPLPVRDALGELEGDTVTEAVEHTVGDGVPLSKPLRVPLAEKDALVVDETVEDRHTEGVPLPEREALGEPEGEEVPDDVEHRVEDGLPLREPLSVPLEVNDALVVDEIVEDRHCDGVLLAVLDTQGELKEEGVTEDVKHRDEDGLPVREPVTLSLGENDSMSEGETVEDRHMEGVLLAVREPLGEVEEEVSKEGVGRSEEDLVLSLDLESLPLDDTDTLLVDETV